MMLHEVDTNSKSDIGFLWDLLLERPAVANISHHEMPTWDEHIGFVIGQPYHVWYIITSDGERAGSCYLTKKDEIGIHLLKAYRGKGLATQAIRSLMHRHERARYLANINPANVVSLELFANLGFTSCQVTLEKICASP